MKNIFAAAFLFIAIVPTTAEAELTYFRDPIYKTLAPEDHHPMQDMIDLASSGDAQAQFILGDLYAKGKGGLEKSPRLARGWFEKSAYNGYGAGFIRLAALSKDDGDLKSALAWYTLGADYAEGGHRKWAQQQIKALLAGKKLNKDDIAEARKTAARWRQDMRRRIEQEPKPLKKAEVEVNKTFIGPPTPAAVN